MSSEISQAIEKFLREDPDAQAAFEAMLRRGKTREEAHAELATVFVLCIRDAANGVPAMTDQLRLALKAIGQGQSAQSFFREP